MKENEYVDIYDRNKNKTGKIKIRHQDKLEENEYIIGVQLIILNKNNEILITKRSNTKMVLPGKWECNGGAIAAGETPIEGLEREIKEELGITLDREKTIYYKTVIDDDRHNIKDIFVYKDDVDINSLSFSNNEVIDAKYVTIDEFMNMFNSGDIVYNVDFNKDDYIKITERIYND
jgi:isopentenyldiphosphate isomerase